MAADGASYYTRRSARDPEWRDAQIQGAREREARRREQDPEGLRAARREATRRCREQTKTGLTFHELLATSPRPDATSLALVLRDEIARGHVDYHPTSRRYSLNGGLPDDVKAALRELEL